MSLDGYIADPNGGVGWMNGQEESAENGDSYEFGSKEVGDYFYDADGNDLPKTVISREYSSEWKPGDEPYYPVNDEKNGALYAEYKKLADAEPKVIFGGRLGEYRYYDMDQVIAAALERAGVEKSK